MPLDLTSSTFADFPLNSSERREKPEPAFIKTIPEGSVQVIEQQGQVLIQLLNTQGERVGQLCLSNFLKPEDCSLALGIECATQINHFADLKNLVEPTLKQRAAALAGSKGWRHLFLGIFKRSGSVPI